MPNAIFSSTKYSAKASRFDAQITSGQYTWRAELDWKPAHTANRSSFAADRTAGKESGPRVVHASSEGALRAELQRLDETVRFVKPIASRTDFGTKITASNADAELLEQMRIDPTVSDTVYNRACKNFGAPIGKRPDFAPTPIEKPTSPYSAEEREQLNGAFLETFLRLHPELTAAGHQDYNSRVLIQWHRDSGLEFLTKKSLEQAHSECFALGFFRTATSGTRTRGELPQSNIVYSYSWEKIQNLRNPPEEPAKRTIAPGSPEESADRARLLRLATNHVASLNPGLNSKSGEFQRQVMALVREWAINPAMGGNPNLARKAGHF
jgi:hypothetical protein